MPLPYPTLTYFHFCRSVALAFTPGCRWQAVVGNAPALRRHGQGARLCSIPAMQARCWRGALPTRNAP